MALTLEQKKANKDASLLKRAAHRSRLNELNTELNKIDLRELHEAAKDAAAKSEAALKVRNDEENMIRDKITELQDQLGKVQQSNQPLIEAANKRRKKAYKAWDSEREKQTNLIKSRYPDLVNEAMYYSGSWNAPAGYIERFAEENTEALAKKKAKRSKSATAA